MTTNLKRVATLFMVAMLALSAVGMAFTGGVAAETTTLAGDGSDSATGFEANASDHLEYDLSSDGTDFSTDNTSTALLNITYDGEQYYETSADVDGTNSSYTFNVSHSELEKLPGDAGANTTITVNAWGEDADGNETTSMDTFNVDLEFASTYAVTNVDDDSATIEDVEASSWNTFSFGLLGDEEPNDLHTYEQTVGINGSDTTVTVYDDTENGSSVFEDAMGDDLESGDVITGAAVAADGTPILAFYEEADTDVVSDGDTYAVYNGDGSWTIHTGDAQDGNSEMDVFIESESYTAASQDFDKSDMGSIFLESADMGVMDAFSAFGTDAFTSFSFGDLLPF
ncbi:hypothetical protein [Halopiger xanaduensis]|uniref:Uncharacterized protein n=1 Tax=Halopiger xanaduensis (strain DSM 18323 / JCM 14033 / SH-6) TaxID=797210 RepID=F8DEU8_HALXS|nr:hypothetical protein [Halopiger xanaduensis]AEH39538.1 hypothetical protein Halxa_0299 [Halopiger xanaduensis SH-6]